MKERNPEKSKQRILQAAEQEFAQKGFFGARVDEIAAAAQINKRMLYAYFEDKENLYKQVLFQVYGRMEAVERQLVARQLQGKQLVEEIIRSYFDFLQSNPTFVNILMWENLNQGKYLQGLESSRIERSTIRYFVEQLQWGKENGIFQSNIDPWHTAVSLITTCFANFSNQYTLSKLFHTDMAGENWIQQRKEHTVQLMLAYLCENT